MSEENKQYSDIDDILSMEDETLGTSISISIGENSVHIKEKPKPAKETSTTAKDVTYEEKWWLKKSEPQIGTRTCIKLDMKQNKSCEHSPDVTSSVREFLNKEKLCKAMHINESERKDKDDTLCDILASVAFDKYPSDFENATDEDIGSILEEMSKIAGALSPSSAPGHRKSGNSLKYHTEEERSVEELLEEAEKLVRENSNSLSKSSSKSNTLISDKGVEDGKTLNRVTKLETDIFHLIEQEVHKESEKIRNSPRSEKGKNSNSNIENMYESLHGFRSSRNFDLQKKRFDDQKAEVSSNSDLDDPIERHSKSEELKRVDETKDNLQKEITDVDKDFFQNLLRKSKEKSEGGMSGSSSFGQEDFSHFLKLLQAQDGSDATNLPNQDNMYNFLLKSNDDKDGKSSNMKSPAYPEKEITEILEKELLYIEGTKTDSKMKDNEVPKEIDNTKSKTVENYIRLANEEKMAEAKKVVNSSNELYTVDLTPRLELFADAIPKLIAEKSSENLKQEQEKIKTKTDESSLILISKKCIVKPKDPPRERVSSAPESRSKKEESKFGKSRSYDQLVKPSVSAKPELPKKTGIQLKQPLIPKTKVQSKPLLKSKMTAKPRKEPWKSGSVSSLPLSTRSHPVISKSGIDPTKKNLTKSDWEILYKEEKHKNSLLKQQIESEAKQYKSQIESMRMSFEQELFSLKKQNIILKAKADEQSLKEKKIEPKNENSVALLEAELERQEKLIKTYEAENKKLLKDTKCLQEEAKNLRQKQKSTSMETSEFRKLADQVKDLQEESLKLNLEAADLRQKNTEYMMKNDDLNQQNSLLKDELEMFKEQLSIKNNFITTRLQAMTTAELALKKQMEDLKVELSSKTEQLKFIKLDYDKLQHGVLPVEKELLELRVKETTMQEKLQVTKNHMEREKQLSQRLKDQVIQDNKKILDLTRQVREMERILKRKNPDSMAALILSTNFEQDKANAEKVKQLEEKIVSLETKIKVKEVDAQQKVLELQKRLNDANNRHAIRVVELEEKLLEQRMLDEQKSCIDAATQTILKPVDGKSSDIKRDEKVQNAEKNVRVGLKLQNPKDDTYFIATIRGMKLELANKDKSIMKLTKEFQELQKTNRRLQKEREKLLNDKRNVREEKTNRSLLFSKTSEVNDSNSNVYQNGHVSNAQKLSASNQKLYDPLQFSENSDTSTVKRLTSEKEVLKEELSKMNKDFMALKNKRLHDLNLLQEEHERELADIVKEYSVKIGDSKLIKLQSQFNTQLAVISHLRQQIEKLQDYKEQTVVLRAERDHLENKVKMLNEKVKYLSTPSTEQLQLLQDKITILQQRHESREMTLQNLVRQLMRNKTQCRNCKGEKGKSRQLCYFRQELDHILVMLQEIANVQ